MVIVIVLVVLVVALAGTYIAINNGIIVKDNRCDNAWETIEAQLQRRNDLIPNLVNTVKGYASHESETLMAVTNARAAISSAATPEAMMEADGQLTQALGRLFAVAEAYPDLKANTNFQQLQTELANTEDKLSYARMSYNDCVLEYNNAITTFPGSLIAGGRSKRRGFQAAEGAHQAPTVQF